jgi:hypothetical protein
VAKDIEAQTVPWVFNLHDPLQGIQRQLGEGITTRLFVGDNVMLSVVRIAPHSSGTVHSGVCCWKASAYAFRATKKCR